MKKAFALLISLALVACGGGDNGSADRPTFLAEVHVNGDSAPPVLIPAGSEGQITMESGQRIVLSTNGPIAAAQANFCMDALEATETSVSWVLNTNIDTTVDIWIFPPDNEGPDAWPAPRDPMKTAALSVYLKANRTSALPGETRPNLSKPEDCF